MLLWHSARSRVKGHLELYHAFIREPPRGVEVVRSTEEVSSTQQESNPDWEIVENNSAQSNVESAVQVWAVLSLLGYFCKLYISLFRALLMTCAYTLSCRPSSARFKCKYKYWDANWLICEIEYEHHVTRYHFALLLVTWCDQQYLDLRVVILPSIPLQVLLQTVSLAPLLIHCQYSNGRTWFKRNIIMF